MRSPRLTGDTNCRYELLDTIAEFDLAAPLACMRNNLVEWQRIEDAPKRAAQVSRVRKPSLRLAAAKTDVERRIRDKAAAAFSKLHISHSAHAAARRLRLGRTNALRRQSMSPAASSAAGSGSQKSTPQHHHQQQQQQQSTAPSPSPSPSPFRKKGVGLFLGGGSPSRSRAGSGRSVLSGSGSVSGDFSDAAGGVVVVGVDGGSSRSSRSASPAPRLPSPELDAGAGASGGGGVGVGVGVGSGSKVPRGRRKLTPVRLMQQQKQQPRFSITRPSHQRMESFPRNMDGGDGSER